MKKGLNQWSVPTGTPIREFLKIAASSGFDGAELLYRADGELGPHTSGDEAQAIAREAAQLGVEIIGFASGMLFNEHSLAHGSESDREKARGAVEHIFATAQALSGGVTSSAIDMGATPAAGYYTRVVLEMTVVWGTSTTMDVTGEYSSNGTDWFAISRCTSAATHICAPRKWQFDPTDGTAVSLEYMVGAPWVRFTLEDAGAGTGTVVVSAVRSP